MKILAFGASNSSNSINKQLAEAVAQLSLNYVNNAEIEILDLNDYEMPLYGVDKEVQSGLPNLALEFAQKVDTSDLLIISLAEHNGSYSVAFKNIFDWISRIPHRKAWGDKKTLLLSTSPGPRGGITVLDIAKNRLPFSGAIVIGALALPSFSENFTDGKITHKEFLEELNVILKTL